MSNLKKLVEDIQKALADADSPILRVDHVARVIGTDGQSLQNQLTLLQQMEDAGLQSNPFQLVPWRNRKMYGVDFDKVLAREVTTKSNGKEVKQKHYWPGVMLKSEERTQRLAVIRDDAQKLVDAGWTEMYDIQHNANGIVLTLRSDAVTSSADVENSEPDAESAGESSSDDESDDE